MDRKLLPAGRMTNHDSKYGLMTHILISIRLNMLRTVNRIIIFDTSENIARSD